MADRKRDPIGNLQDAWEEAWAHSSCNSQRVAETPVKVDKPVTAKEPEWKWDQSKDISPVASKPIIKQRSVKESLEVVKTIRETGKIFGE